MAGYLYLERQGQSTGVQVPVVESPLLLEGSMPLQPYWAGPPYPDPGPVHTVLPPYTDYAPYSGTPQDISCC